MLFNSSVFLVFFAVFILGWRWAKRNASLRWAYIILFSLFFYGWWSWKYVPLLLGTGLVDFLAGLGIARYSRYAKSILFVSLGSNLFVLGLFKYSGLFSQSACVLSGLFGSAKCIQSLDYVLPVGISFYTFQSMSYTIDIYRKEIQPTRNLLHFYAAITMFPHLVAGPIMRAAKLLPQLLQNRPITRLDRWEGLRLIAHGYFKKMVIADNLAPAINDAFSGQLSYADGLSWWLIICMFAVQIYCDFSGYSDIARGLAKWMGYDFTLNFNHPYMATSLQDFWRRWHISLSTWFRDYVFKPLGGSRDGDLQTCRNILITMALSGLWHGAGWTFVIWGIFHGTLLSLERLTGWPQRVAGWKAGRVIAWGLVLLQVLIGWVFFRSRNMDQAIDILGALGAPWTSRPAISGTALLFFAVAIVHELYVWKHIVNSPNRLNITVAESTVLVAILMACVFLRGPGGAFIYFQF